MFAQKIVTPQNGDTTLTGTVFPVRWNTHTLNPSKKEPGKFPFQRRLTLRGIVIQIARITNHLIGRLESSEDWT